MIGLIKNRTVIRDQGGTASIEFAMLLLPLCTLLIGTMEFGYQLYTRAIVEGAVREAARMASTGEYTSAQIDAKVISRLQSYRKGAAPTITKKSYADFTGVGIAEPITSGSVESGEYCYEDVNADGQWNEDQGKNGTGNAEDVVYYQVDLSYPTLFPFSMIYFSKGTSIKVSANTIVSNEPYAAVVQQEPQTICV